MDPYFDVLKTYCQPLTKLKSSVPAQITFSIGSAVIGIILLVLFFSFFMSTPAIVKIMPVFFGFNAAMAGFSLIDKTGDRLPHKLIYAACSGIVTVLFAWLILSFILDFSMLVRGVHLIWYSLTGLGGGLFGGWLAVKNHKLKNTLEREGRQSRNSTQKKGG